jgi:hypothetical protein
VVNNPDDPSIADWHSIVDNFAITPLYFDSSYIDPSQQKSKVNALLLQEICDRSKRQQSMTEGMDDFYRFLRDQVAKESPR